MEHTFGTTGGFYNSKTGESSSWNPFSDVLNKINGVLHKDLTVENAKQNAIKTASDNLLKTKQEELIKKGDYEGYLKTIPKDEMDAILANQKVEMANPNVRVSKKDQTDGTASYGPHQFGQKWLNTLYKNKDRYNYNGPNLPAKAFADPKNDPLAHYLAYQRAKDIQSQNPKMDFNTSLGHAINPGTKVNQYINKQKEASSSLK